MINLLKTDQCLIPYSERITQNCSNFSHNPQTVVLHKQWYCFKHSDQEKGTSTEYILIIQYIKKLQESHCTKQIQICNVAPRAVCLFSSEADVSIYNQVNLNISILPEFYTKNTISPSTARITSEHTRDIGQNLITIY